jgi:nitrite reductase/ring-hydroxylating ferredoxin subunit
MQELIRITRLTDIRDSAPLCVQHKGVPYCVVRMQNEIKAYITICSHEDKVFTPEMKGRCLVCPFHKVYFNAASGEVHDGNGKRVPQGLVSVATEVRDGWLYLVAEEAHHTLLAQSEARRQERRARKRSRRGWLNFLR